MAHLRISHAPWRFPLLSWGFHVFLWGVPRFIKGFPEGLHWMTWGCPWTHPRAPWRISLISLSIYMDFPISPSKPLQISSRTLPEGLHLFSLRTFTRGSQGFLWFPRWVHRFTGVVSQGFHLFPKWFNRLPWRTSEGLCQFPKGAHRLAEVSFQNSLHMLLEDFPYVPKDFKCVLEWVAGLPNGPLKNLIELPQDFNGLT